MYEQNDVTTLSRRILLEKVEGQFGDDIVSFHPKGVATLVVFKDNVASKLNIVCTEDDDEVTIKKLSKEMLKELKTVKEELESYDVHIDKQLASECTSPLLKKLSNVQSNFLGTDSSPSLPFIMIGNIVASVTTNQPTSLQIALDVLMGEHKSLITVLYNYRITCSYDVVRRFPRSATVQAAQEAALAGMTDASVGGLIQVIIDNFDEVIHSQNCQLHCHNLAMIVTQPHYATLFEDVTIPMLTKEQMKEPIDLDDEAVRYSGPINLICQRNSVWIRITLSLPQICKFIR